MSFKRVVCGLFVASCTGLYAQTLPLGSSAATWQTVNLAASAEWFAGSQHLLGTATLQANADGSSTEQLSLGTASRTVTQSATGSSKACQWADATGQSHEILGANCFVALPWFAPQLFAQPATVLPALLALIDDGNVVRDGITYHQLRYQPQISGPTTGETAQLRDASSVKVLFDLKTILPSRLEYSIHPDGNDLQKIQVSVAFSDYRLASGLLLPFHIEKSVNRLLQLVLNVNAASTK